MTTTARRGRPPHPDVLTPAEWRVVNCVRHGMSNRVAAEILGVSLDAVKFHVENAVAKLGLANRAALKRWRGAPFDSAVARREGEASTKVKIGRVGQISREVKDLETAVPWFRDILGLRLVGVLNDLAFFDMDGIGLLLARRANGHPPGNAIIYFRVDDINAAFEGLSCRGVEFEGAPHMINRAPDGKETWMAFFRDMDGELLAIMDEVAT